MSDFGLPRRGFLNLVGLDHSRSANNKLREVQLAEADIDPHTGGAVAVTTKATLDGKDGIEHLKTYYWRMLPTGEQLSQKLFDIEFEQGESNVRTANNTMVKVPMVIPRAVWVLGRKVYDASDDGDLGGEDSGHASGLMRNLSRVMGAVGEVNRQMREGKLPEVAKILEEFSVHEVVGERLVISGQSSKGGFDFDAPDRKVKSGDIVVPATVAQALMGFDVNTLDSDNRLHGTMSIQGNDPRQGTNFTTQARVVKGNNPRVSTSYAPAEQYESEPATIPRLTSVTWKSDNEGKVNLKELNLLGEDMVVADHLKSMQAMGATNHILHDLRNHRYPRTMDYLVDYDLYDLVYQLEPPPPLKDGGRLTMISVGGNNLEEIAEGFGEHIGGNSKVVYHEGLDKDGKVSRAGVIVDLGLHLSPKDEVNISAAPDIVEHLKHCNDILITHRHLDHTDGLFAYIQYGYLRDKTVHATPEVIRSLRDKLRSYPSIHSDDLPTFAPLKFKGNGWLHVKDEEGKTRLSVNYARNATPHSARTTPFMVHGHYDGKWVGSYLNHGDARYGRHNGDGYEGPPVDADHLDKAFFTEGNKRLLEEVPGLDPKIIARRPTYFDMDITSILRQGWAPTEPEVEQNLVKISSWFEDKGILLAMISTNDNRFETALRMATQSHRDLTEFGTNLEKTATTANVSGVNDLRVDPVPRNNIQHYLDWYYEERLKEKIEGHKESLKTAGEDEKAALIEKLKRNEARLEYFRDLRKMPSSFRRFNMRKEMEADLQARFGRDATLGSIEMASPGESDDLTLGAMRVGRTSKTSRHIMGEQDGRRLVLLTGTQGTNIEVDAAMTSLSEGRSLMDGSNRNSHTARPINPANNVVVISQTAIPGNNGKQNELVRKLVGRGFTVVQAVHDGFQIHNIDKKDRERITAEAKKLGKSFKIEEDGSLIVSGMPIHASGHGYQEDCRSWINLVKADFTAAQHTDDPQGGKRFAELCESGSRHHMERVVPNFEGLSIRAGDNADATEIRSVGRTLASLIIIEIERQKRQYYGGHMKVRRVINQDPEAGWLNGLRATARPGGAHDVAFASVDAEEAAKQLAHRKGVVPEPIPENRTEPIQEHPHSGPNLPGRNHRHRVLRPTTHAQRVRDGQSVDAMGRY